MTKTLFKNGNVFYHGKLQKLDVLIEDELISKVAKSIDEGDQVIDLQGKLLTPGFVDLHVHLREPGFEHKETIATGTNSAKYGGYSHIVAMANTKPCMDDVETIRDFANRVKKDAKIHTYTYSAITTDLKGQELVDFKANSQEDIVAGFSDDGRGVQSTEMMEAAMKAAKSVNSIIVAHCEDESELQPGACVNLGDFSKENNGFLLNQFSNLKNTQAHYQNTAVEIDNKLGKVDGFISGIGTGGTLMGIGTYFKDKYNSKIIALEPVNMSLLKLKTNGSHIIEGIGDEFIPDLVNREVIDEIITLSDEEVFKITSKLAKELGLGVGFSSGANALATIIANKNDGKYVTVFVDDNKKYLSNNFKTNAKTIVDEITFTNFKVVE